MKMDKLLMLLFPIYLALAAVSHSASGQSISSSNPLVGRWDLTLKSPAGGLPSWIEVSADQGTPQVLFVGIMDHATPPKKLAISGTEIQFLSPKGEEGFSSDMFFHGKLVGDQLVGTVTDSAGITWPWTGSRAPRLDRKGTPQWGSPIKLFDGTDLTGWKLQDPRRPGTWKVENGTLVTTGRGSDLVTTSKFGDFQLHIEFKNAASTNSGVYLRGRYELQIETMKLRIPLSSTPAESTAFSPPILRSLASPKSGRVSTLPSSDAA